MPSAKTFILPVIMCGGSGTRLWPASRESMPKQFIPLLDEQSTFQATARRVSNALVFDRLAVITNSDGRFIVAEQLKEAAAAGDIILESTRRDSAAAVAVAASYAARKNPDAVVLIVAADHLIPDAQSFIAACEKAAEGAHQGLIMTLGIAPTNPATRYGYIAPGEPLPGSEAYRVERFVEKPDEESAREYIARGYSGIVAIFFSERMSCCRS